MSEEVKNFIREASRDAQVRYMLKLIEAFIPMKEVQDQLRIIAEDRSNIANALHLKSVECDKLRSDLDTAERRIRELEATERQTSISPSYTQLQVAHDACQIELTRRREIIESHETVCRGLELSRDTAERKLRELKYKMLEHTDALDLLANE